MAFNQRFKKLITSLGFKQIGFSEELNVHKSTISKLVNGNIEPSLDLLQNLRRKFNINLNWLINGDGKMREGLHEDLIDPVEEPVANYEDNKLKNMLIDSLKGQVEILKADNERLRKKCEKDKNTD